MGLTKLENLLIGKKTQAKNTRFSKWPYWLRGGSIGATVTAVFVGIFYLCALIPSPPGSELGFVCFYPLLISPTYPVMLLFNNLFPGLPFEYLPLISILIWFLTGSLIGQFIAKLKSHRNSTKN